jgi:hypothetical protein
MQEQGGRLGDLARGILSDLRTIPVIDTHEHLPYAEDKRDRDTDVLKEYLSHYMSSDIVSAGMPPADLLTVRDHSRPLPERWRLVEPFWEACRYTGYGRALDAAVREIYGIDGIRGNTIDALNAAFLDSLAPGHYKRVLKDLCGIRVSILDGFIGGSACDRSFFRRAWQPHYSVPEPRASEMILATEKEQSVTIKSISDWMEAFDRELEEMLAQGIVALKSATAYSRSLLFRNVPFAAARAAFSESLHGWKARGRKATDDFSLPAEAQDFMMHHILKRANEKHLVFQFHTGLQEGNGNTIANSDPSLMSNLFLAYPEVDFDLFHISYPYQGVAATLVKNFRNVFVDMCWAHIISPAASRAALSDFLDVLPFTKISAFGGDYMFVDGICGHLMIARENVARTLAEKVSDGVFSNARAIEIGRALFHDNPLRIFRLQKDLAP